jgi:hypothetical protein
MEISVLLGYYKNLLSDRQKEYMIQHFEEDLSLSEIAKEFDVSRQAVYDNIRRGIKILKDYEDKLSLYERDKCLIDELKKLRKNLSKEKLDEIIANLEI